MKAGIGGAVLLSGALVGVEALFVVYRPGDYPGFACRQRGRVQHTRRMGHGVARLRRGPRVLHGLLLPVPGSSRACR
eukprot:2964991-Alexandrium_andersonii.AAC.1